MFPRSSFRFIWLILALALIGCSSAPAPTPTRAPIPTIILPTNIAPIPLATNPPLPTNTPAPTLAPTPSVKATPTRAPVVPAGSMRVKIFMIALNDAGKLGKKIGCDDSVVAVERIIPLTNAVLRASLNELLSLRASEYGESGLRNALAPSTLKVDDITLVAGRATIYLSGNLALGGACDNPRVDAQIKETALQFSTVRQVSILINKIALDKILSGKGN
ncbi:MAG: hypothetical protein FJ009_10640 [Chloroflexi bacterium]|nr:hypothetical protein [Chloroflexota bacterium]